MTTTTTCETVRDALPALARGALDGPAGAATRAHVETCAACAAELALARMLVESSVAAPRGLADRVLADARTRRGYGGLLTRRSLVGVGIAAAAVLALVLVPSGDAPDANTAVPGAAVAAGPSDAVGTADPFLDDDVLEDGDAVALELGPIAEQAAQEEAARVEAADEEAIPPLAMDLGERRGDWPGADGASAGAMTLDDLTIEELELLLAMMETEMET